MQGWFNVRNTEVCSKVWLLGGLTSGMKLSRTGPLVLGFLDVQALGSRPQTSKSALLAASLGRL